MSNLLMLLLLSLFYIFPAFPGIVFLELCLVYWTGRLTIHFFCPLMLHLFSVNAYLLTFFSLHEISRFPCFFFIVHIMHYVE